MREVKEGLKEYIAFSWACKDVQNVSEEQLGDKENREHKTVEHKRE